MFSTQETPLFPANRREWSDCTHHLRVLLHVFENPEQSWSPDAVCARLHLNRRTAVGALTDLAGRGLLVCTNERGPAYRMARLSRGDSHAILRLRELDQVRPVTLINLVAGPTRRRLPVEAPAALDISAS